MAQRGRKGIYETAIKPRFDDIAKWLENGATEKQVYEALGISKDAFYKYKKENSEFSELIKKSRKSLVVELRGALIKKALGFSYEEEKVISVKGKATGKMVVEKIETYRRQALPDVAALNLCLKNYDSENWANDPQLLKIKQEELELKKKIFEEGNW